MDGPDTYSDAQMRPTVRSPAHGHLEKGPRAVAVEEREAVGEVGARPRTSQSRREERAMRRSWPTRAKRIWDTIPPKIKGIARSQRSHR